MSRKLSDYPSISWSTGSEWSFTHFWGPYIGQTVKISANLPTPFIRRYLNPPYASSHTLNENLHPRIICYLRSSHPAKQLSNHLTNYKHFPEIAARSTAFEAYKKALDFIPSDIREAIQDINKAFDSNHCTFYQLRVAYLATLLDLDPIKTIYKAVSRLQATDILKQREVISLTKRALLALIKSDFQASPLEIRFRGSRKKYERLHKTFQRYLQKIHHTYWFPDNNNNIGINPLIKAWPVNYTYRDLDLFTRTFNTWLKAYKSHEFNSSISTSDYRTIVRMVNKYNKHQYLLNLEVANQGFAIQDHIEEIQRLLNFYTNQYDAFNNEIDLPITTPTDFKSSLNEILQNPRNKASTLIALHNQISQDSQQIRDAHRIDYYNSIEPIYDLDLVPSEIATDKLKLTKLTTPKELDSEGKIMHHCVGMYYPDVRSGRSAIYSITYDENHIATAEVLIFTLDGLADDGAAEPFSFRINQISGHANQPIAQDIEEQVRQAITNAMQEVNIELMPYDIS